MKKNDSKTDNERAVKAASDPLEKERFLSDAGMHILALTARICSHPVTRSDDEWSAALLAVSDAIDTYDPEKGDFWGYAAKVIKNRLINMYRKEQRSSREIPVSPQVFDGEITEDDPEISVKLKVMESLTADNPDPSGSLADEILTLTKELESYGITFFDLTKCSPRAEKTKRGCAEVIASIFLPPPLVEYLKKKKILPSAELQKRSGQSVKFLDKFRKYLITTTLILDGDYPQIAEYVQCMKPAIQENSGKEHFS
ncbi:MAG: hypothetical protein K6F86_09530 [Lachnospiraceae bacterium]|nr:hypothetical protein [Lachnospiraceae bacterium]